MVNQMYKPDDEQALADTLQKILDPDYVHESLSDELEMFRSRYFDASGTWLDEDEVADKYEQFKNGMRAATDLSAFQDSEFDDFPEFLEREVMLSLKYNDDSDYVSEEDDDYVDDGDGDVDVEVHDDEYEPPKIEEMQEYTPTESELRSYVNGDIEVENLTRVLRDLKTGESATTLEQMLQRQYKQ
ncbi:uncharacterized protein SPAPADRAFT_60464 [Spathaspora passalidarum NRRL Y-27907]|uniref:Uncharacterized protein n=1 Tax=Spathaspora passalidarum (strain NRRL Y-27907 / 11-Y1) TaxID=619300 RepID=G3ALB6_SPAPN|nr:uncharacterized protein SPAPADRAFT_60464 [Spathaspora passalidarum NRRL Y-27907]EGW33158.1 hypothetical protein SPAPADRAFT_60464 [Spathaspora passalidarum NRRL Y-27907]